jgi:hypothetical protein
MSVKAHWPICYAPLNKEKQEVMRNLLESVQTPRLKNAFEKYLPAVLTDRSVKAPKVITESVSTVTGDKSARSQIEDDSAETAMSSTSSAWQGFNLKGDIKCHKNY